MTRTTVSTDMLKDGAITTAKLAASALSADAAGRAKMADGFLSADAAGLAKMADGYVTLAKLAAAVVALFPTTGDERLTWKTVADAGWIMLNDGTIGSAASGATTRANADTEALFTLWWNNCADAQCPVSTGRGASAAADFAANKTLKTPLALGRMLAIAGAGAGLTSRVLGLAIGAETHTLSIAEMPAHTHTTVDGAAGGSGPGDGANVMGNTETTSSTGGDGAHNNMSPSGFRNVMVKL